LYSKTAGSGRTRSTLSGNEKHTQHFGRNTLARRRRGCDDNTKIYRGESVDWIKLAQDRLLLTWCLTFWFRKNTHFRSAECQRTAQEPGSFPDTVNPSQTMLVTCKQVQAAPAENVICRRDCKRGSRNIRHKSLRGEPVAGISLPSLLFCLRYGQNSSLNHLRPDQPGIQRAAFIPVSQSSAEVMQTVYHRSLSAFVTWGGTT
jgi:hypothetical protein